MPKVMTIGYDDQADHGRIVADVREAAHANDDLSKTREALIGTAGPLTQVRDPDANRVKTLQGAFMSSPLPIAGFALIEAANLAETVEPVSKSPCAAAQGAGEVWPFEAG